MLTLTREPEGGVYRGQFHIDLPGVRGGSRVEVNALSLGIRTNDRWDSNNGQNHKIAVSL